ncbi:hypothetical protein AAC387_Pa01g2038 [Persea americana]
MAPSTSSYISKIRSSPVLPFSHQRSEKWSSQMIISLTKLITDHGKNGEFQKSRKIFDEMPHRNQITWNAMLTVLVHSLQLEAACQLFEEMPERDSTSYTLMISGFSRSGLVIEARELFDSIPSSHQNVVLWTAMISCYTLNRLSLQALKLFCSCYGDFFALGIVPNSFTFSIMLKVCADMQSRATADQIHALIVKLLDEEDRGNVFVQNSLIDLHSKFGDLIKTEEIFNGLKWRDLSTWNTIMACYTRHSLVDKALEVFFSMKEKDTLSWNIVMSCLGDSGRGEEALMLFHHLLRLSTPVKPNPSTYTIILTVCATLTALELGRQIHTCTVKLGLSQNNVFTGNSLITMYARCGQVIDLEQVFSEMPKKDVVSWNSVILGLSQNGYARKALEIAKKALKLEAFNHNTFIAILTSCSHGGMVDEGMECFRTMRENYGIEPCMDHYICVIDMLGRAGRITDAHNIFPEMTFGPNSVAWMTLLSACLAHGNAQVGEIAARELQNLEPDNVTSYVMLASLYGKTGRVEESKKVLSLMRKKQLRKEPGCSWIVKM